MNISLAGRQRNKFRTDLLAHRESFTLNDADYADQVLKISLNTYKKCVQQADKAPLVLKRHTYLSIFANASLDPRNYGLTIGIPMQDSPYGGYNRDEFQYLCGRFFLHRRSFLTARQITCGVLEIRPSANHECLAFSELQHYTSETGAREELRYHGDIYMNRERSIMSLPAFSEGHVRLTMLQAERVGARGKVKMRGALLTFGNPKGFWQPTVSCVFADGPIDTKRTDIRDLCRTIDEGSEEYGPLSDELARVEEHATIMTPLMWARSRVKPTGS